MKSKLIAVNFVLSIMTFGLGIVATVLGDFQSAVLAHLTAIYLLILTRKVDDGR